jgi:anti-anti-sigma regulatory factor
MDQGLGGVMLILRIEHIGDLAIVECKGRIVRSDATLKLHEAVTAQQNVRIVVLDLTQVRALEGGGLGMLWFLQRWAEDHDIHFKLYNPINSVRDKLEHNHAMLRFDIATFEEMVSLVDHADNRYARAA